MLCPRCQLALVNDRCPKCGLALRKPIPRSNAKATEQRKAPTTPHQPFLLDDRLDWRVELKQRVRRRVKEDKPKKARAEGKRPKASRKELGELAADEIPDISGRPKKRKLGEDSQLQSSSKEFLPLDGPLERKASQKGSQRKAEPPVARQVSFQLETTLDSSEQEPPEIAQERPTVDREILFSRFLAGLIDLSLPFLTGIFFAATTSIILEFDFFLSYAMELSVALGFSFFVFNSLFFLVSCGQTPGMYLTELKLVHEDIDEEVSLAQVILRVMAFLPSAISVVGLIWSLFDPFQRCLHDLVSQTRVEAATRSEWVEERQTD